MGLSYLRSVLSLVRISHLMIPAIVATSSIAYGLSKTSAVEKLRKWLGCDS